MTVVGMPDGTQVDFGDLPPDQIKSMIASKFPDAARTPLQAPTTPIGVNSGSGSAFGEGLANAIPFGGKISSGLAALATRPLSGDIGLKDLYDQAQADSKATAEGNPLASLAGNVAGIGATLPLAGPLSKVAGSALNAIPGVTGAAAAAGNLIRGGQTAADAGPLANLAIRAGQGAAMAAPVGAAYSAGSADPGQELHDAGVGALVGGGLGAALPVAGGTLKALVPKVSEGLRDVASLAQKYDIPLSFDQITSSRAVKNAQKVSQELPFSGQAAFRDKQMSSFNSALLNTVGIDGTKFTRANMDKAFTDVGKQFDSLGAGKTFQLGDDFYSGLDQIRQDAQSTATADAVSNFNHAVENQITKNVGPDGTISGEKLGQIRSNINSLARKANNPDTQDLLHDLENNVIDAMTSGDDAASGTLSDAKQKYKNLLVLEPLASKAKAGNISPSQLNSRVAKIYGRSYVRGKAGPIGDLAQIGHEILPELGGSDTTQKLLYAGGLGGLATGAAINPAGALGAAGTIAGTSALNRLAQSGLNRNQSIIASALIPRAPIAGALSSDAALRAIQAQNALQVNK